MSKKVHINKGGIQLFVAEEEVAMYQSLGWASGTGIIPPKVLKPKQTGKHMSTSKWMTDGEVNKRIQQTEVAKYLKQGWKLGRTGYGETMAAKKWLHADGKSRRVSPDQLEKFPIPPWAFGRDDKSKEAMKAGRERRKGNDSITEKTVVG